MSYDSWKGTVPEENDPRDIPDTTEPEPSYDGNGNPIPVQSVKVTDPTPLDTKKDETPPWPSSSSSAPSCPF